MTNTAHALSREPLWVKAARLPRPAGFWGAWGSSRGAASRRLQGGGRLQSSCSCGETWGAPEAVLV